MNRQGPAHTVATRLASAIDARQRCLQTGNDWAAKHTAVIHTIAKDILPSGSGIDSGTTVDLDRSTGEKLVLVTSYHHMNDGGYYDGWTEHTITVRASLLFQLDIRISGSNRNDIKSYLTDVFTDVLRSTCVETYDTETEMSTFEVTA